MVKYLDKNSGFAQWSANKQETSKKSSFSGFVWWFILFIASWWLIGSWLAPKQDVKNGTQEEVIELEDVSNVPVSSLDSEKLSAQLRGLRISNVELKDFYKNPSDKESEEKVVLLDGDNVFTEIGFVATGTAAPDAKTVWKKNDNKYTWKNSDGVTFNRTVNVDGYVITVTDEVVNNSKQNITLAPYARLVRKNDMTSSAGVYTGPVAYVNSDIERNDWKDLDKKSYAYSTTNGFIGFVDQYWETIVSLNSADQTMRFKKQGDNYQADVSSTGISVAPGTTETLIANVYMGPRDSTALTLAEKAIAGLEETVDYGWFWFFVQPILWLLSMLNALVMNYGVAIILLTILLRLLMWPLTRKSYVSMLAMQKMQPEMARIQKLYANDKPRMQMEMMRLYQTHKTSPMSGCLPMLLQIPIFFALYKALLISVQMRSESFLWISDLAAMDPYFILPVLMGLTMWLQQVLQNGANKKAASNANDVAAQTQKVMKWMPVLFTVMFAWMPAGLVLYWTVSNIFGIIQMYILKKKSEK